MASVTRSFRLSTDLEARLLAVAASEDRPVSWVIVKTLEAGLPGGVEAVEAAREPVAAVSLRVARDAPPASPRASVDPMASRLARQAKLNEQKASKR